MDFASHTDKAPYFDATILHHADNLRGVPQVAMLFLRLLASDHRLLHIRIVTTRRAYKKHIQIIGLDRSRIAFLEPIPLIGRFERYHGLFCDFRYRKLKQKATGFIHPEPRTVLRTKSIQIVFFHDLIHFAGTALSGKRKWDRYLYFKWKYAKAVRVSYIITNSNHTRLQLLSRYPSLDANSVTPLHPACRQSVYKGVPKILGNGSVRFLYVGAAEPRKNLDVMIRRFSDFANPDVDELHLVGAMECRRMIALEKLAKEMGMEHSLIIHGLISDSELANLYASAHFFAFPSLAEGFGIPLIEAMANGLFVLAFDNSSIGEVVQDGGFLAQDNDFRAWGERVMNVRSEISLYQEQVIKGLQRATHFTEKETLRRYGDYLSAVILGPCQRIG